MTLVLIGKVLVLEGGSPKIEDKQVPGIYHIYIYIFQSYSHLPSRNSSTTPSSPLPEVLLPSPALRLRFFGPHHGAQSASDQRSEWKL